MLANLILAYSVTFNQPRHSAGGMHCEADFSMRISLTLLSALVACAALGAPTADGAETVFELAIVRNAVAAEQRVLKVQKGDALRVRITSDTPGELHLHGYRLAATLVPGRPAELAFRAHATGRYPFEWHGSLSQEKAGAHRGPPLATLEVRPK